MDAVTLAAAVAAGKKAAVNPARALAVDAARLRLGSPPLGVSRALRSAGQLVAGFGTGLWTLSSGTATLTQGYSGFDASGNRTGIVSRTGAQQMLTLAPSDNTDTEIKLSTPSTNIRTAALNGRFGLWVYLANQPGYDPATNNPTGNLGITLTTNAAASFTNALYVSYNINQLREGWNFLTFVQRNPAAYVPANTGVTEDHPFGISCTGFGTGVDTDIVHNPITGIKVDVKNLSGATVYLDSLWTGFSALPQIVPGTDAAGTDLTTLTLPLFQQFGWVGYIAVPVRIWNGGDTVVTDFTAAFTTSKTCYALGWEQINHTTNHFPGNLTTPKMGTLTDPAQLSYEIEQCKALYMGNGLTRGQSFYASPQSSSSRLSEKVIKDSGIVVQRHVRKANVAITAWGVDNLAHLGASDIGNATTTGISTVTAGVSGSVAGWQKYSQIKRMIDAIVAYGDTWFPFWHGVTTLGDTGSGEDLTGDNLLITYSALQKTLAYIAQLDTAGTLRVRDGISGWLYGTGR